MSFPRRREFNHCYNPVLTKYQLIGHNLNYVIPAQAGIQ